jgi:hypothetical protein
MEQVKEMTGWSKTGGFFGAVKRAGLTLTKTKQGKVTVLSRRRITPPLQSPNNPQGTGFFLRRRGLRKGRFLANAAWGQIGLSCDCAHR